MRLHCNCHDPAVQSLIPFLDAILGAHRVTAERGGQGGHAALDAWMQGPGASLPKPPDIVLHDFDGPLSHTLIDVKTFDVSGATHVATHHTDTTRLAAHAAVAARCARDEYGPLPPRMRLIVLAVSTFGSIGTPGQALIAELSRRTLARVPPTLLGHASWAVPRLGPMIRMALTHAVRRGAAASIHRHWRRGRFAIAGGGAGDAGAGADAGGGGLAEVDAAGGAVGPVGPWEGPWGE